VRSAMGVAVHWSSAQKIARVQSPLVAQTIQIAVAQQFRFAFAPSQRQEDLWDAGSVRRTDS
jgi:hypothetical protein